MDVLRKEVERRASVQRSLELLRQAKDDLGYTYEALAAHTEKPRSYVHDVLNGRRRCTNEFLHSLPLDMRERHNCLCVEESGYTVIRPAAIESAAGHLVAGLLGIKQLLDVKPEMLKASLATAVAKTEVA